MLLSSIQKGVEIERERYPRAANVFARTGDERVRTESIRAYAEYLHTHECYALERSYLEHGGVGDDLIYVPENEAKEVSIALVQLGCCLVNEIDPFPTTL